MLFAENAILGLDIGIGSVGWALLQELEDGTMDVISKTGKGGEIIYALGSRTFNVPEDAKTKELLNVKRRQARMQRRVIARRADRMRRVRNLLIANVFSSVSNEKELHRPVGKTQMNPWRLRSEALERKLTDDELAVALLHICKHRGFRSNSKRDRGGADKETGKMLKAISELQIQMVESGKATVGAFMAEAERKRNRSDMEGKPVYERTMLRSLLEDEVRHIFAAQRSLGNYNLTENFEQTYAELAFGQRPLKSTKEMVGNCTFVKTEKRAPKFAPTMERFRLSAKLVNLRLTSSTIKGSADYENGKQLTVEEIERISTLLGQQKSIKYSHLRKIINLKDDWQFEGLSYGLRDDKGKTVNPENADIVSRKGECGVGTYAFSQALKSIPGAFNRLSVLRVTPLPDFADSVTEKGLFCLDLLAKLFSDNDDLNFIRSKMAELPLTNAECACLSEALDNAVFASFKGTANLSLRAMEEILPYMIRERSYDKGCALAGFDHSREAELDLDDVRNPVVLRILREVRRQVHCITREFGIIPGRVHIELLRDVGKSADERNKIDRGIKDRTEEKNAHRIELAELFGVEASGISRDELLRYELWKQQGGKCAYYMLWGKDNGERFYNSANGLKEGGIPIDRLRDSAHATQIDHILPRSRTQDNSFHNLCLCIPAANQAKGGNTPYEWIGKNNPAAWHNFEQWVQSIRASGFKRRNFLLKNLDKEKQDCFCERNLNDSRYAARLVMKWFRRKYQEWGNMTDIPEHAPDGREKRRVFARTGGITNFLRQLWGLQSLKKDASGKRVGDRHHALDAFVLACCTESMLQKITKIYQQEEHGKVENFPPPMPDCREKMARLLEGVFVSRAERAGTKGALHEETLRGIRVEKDDEGKEIKMLYKRVPVCSLKKMEDLEKINNGGRGMVNYADLRRWLEAGKPKGAPPRSNKGDVIRHVRMREKPFTSGVELNRGEGKAQADNASMVRTEVYTKGGKFYLVPVYTWQVANNVKPERAIRAHMPEDEWLLIDNTYNFCFSLTSNSYVLTEGNNGDIKSGYFMGTDRSTGIISLAIEHDRKAPPHRIGVQRLARFEKYRVDRLGRLSRVKKEKKP